MDVFGRKYDGLKQILYFEKNINDKGNERKYIIYDTIFKKCYTVQFNNIYNGLEQTPNRSFKNIIYDKNYKL